MNLAYSRALFPPIPVLRLQFGSSIGGERTEWLDALVDTAADGTLVPLRYLLSLDVRAATTGWVRGVTGERRPIAFYYVDVNVGDFTLPGIRVAGDKAASEILVGRDILNKLPLFLDGPQQQSEVLDDATVRRLRARGQDA